MWRGALCLRALLRGGAAASAVGTRRLRAAHLVGHPLISKGDFVTQRSGNGMASAQVQGTEEVVGSEHWQQEEAVGQLEPHGCPEYVTSVFSIDHMVSLLRQENAKDICVIQLPPEMRYSNYFIIVSGSSTRHLHAMAHYLVKTYKHLKTESEPHVLIEGRETDNWLCIDFGNIVVHFMLPETREIYELEKLWTLRSYDDQLTQMVPEILPDDFIIGLPCEQQ